MLLFCALVQSSPLGRYTSFVNPVELTKKDTTSPLEPEHDNLQFAQSARTPKNAPLFSSNDNADLQKAIYNKIEALGGDTEQVRRVVQQFTAPQETKGFLGKVIDKVKNFFSRLFFSYYS